jgi:ribosomal protein S27E
MKNVTCRNCGDTRPAIIAFEGCQCGCEEITLKVGAVTDLINSRTAPRVSCTSCGLEVFGLDVDAYPHPDGWVIPGLSEKWWLSIACPDCNHETSFSHLGINR